jgi:peptide/nickel transport system ATP-binding protein
MTVTSIPETSTLTSDIVLSARNITVEYGGERPTRAVRNVSLDLRRGEVLGIAGESGCGKSTLAFALTRLLRPPATMINGSVHFYGADGGDPVDVIGLDSTALRHFRWDKISMVFQSAMNSLNPVTSLRKQFSDIFEAHRPEMSSDERDARSRGLLEMVGIDPHRLKGFPHELSGGMRQRVGIAMALALNPEVVVMDEPTTALDVVVQRDILEEINALRQQLGFSIIFITHDLPLLVEISDRLVVMYAGEIVERAPSEWVGQSPTHPYTLALQESCPDLLGERRELRGIAGIPPDLRERIDGCSFRPRCSYAFGPCSTVHPELIPPQAQAVEAPNLVIRTPRDAASPKVVDEKTSLRQSPTDLPILGGDWRVACHLHNRELNPEGPPLELASYMHYESGSLPSQQSMPNVVPPLEEPGDVQ